MASNKLSRTTKQTSSQQSLGGSSFVSSVVKKPGVTTSTERITNLKSHSIADLKLDEMTSQKTDKRGRVTGTTSTVSKELKMSKKDETSRLVSSKTVHGSGLSTDKRLVKGSASQVKSEPKLINRGPTCSSLPSKIPSKTTLLSTKKETHKTEKRFETSLKSQTVTTSGTKPKSSGSFGPIRSESLKSSDVKSVSSSSFKPMRSKLVTRSEVKVTSRK